MNIKIVTLILLISNFIFAQDSQVRESVKDKHFIFNTSFGPSFRLGKTPNGLNSKQKEYIKDLKSGFSYDFTLYYTGNGENCFGIKFNRYQSKGSLANQDIVAPNGDSGYGTVSDNISITFIGPAFMIINESDNGKWDYKLEVAIGYTGYLNKAAILDNYELKGATFGMTGGFGFNYKIAKNFSVGPQINFIGGALKQFDITGENGYKSSFKYPKEEFESLWRIDLGLNAIIKF
jgi:hypothetical protein